MNMNNYSVNTCINSLLTRGGLVNLYKMTLYNNINKIEDYEVTSYSTSNFHSLLFI